MKIQKRELVVPKAFKRIAATFITFSTLGYGITYYSLWPAAAFVAGCSIIIWAIKEFVLGIVEALEKRRLDLESSRITTGAVPYYEIGGNHHGSDRCFPTLKESVEKRLEGVTGQVNFFYSKGFRLNTINPILHHVYNIRMSLANGRDPELVLGQVQAIQKEVAELYYEWSVAEQERLNNNQREWIEEYAVPEPKKIKNELIRTKALLDGLGSVAKELEPREVQREIRRLQKDILKKVEDMSAEYESFRADLEKQVSTPLPERSASALLESPLLTRLKEEIRRLETQANQKRFCREIDKIIGKAFENT